MLKGAILYGAVFYLINWQVHLQLAIFLHLHCSCHLLSFVLCIEHAALWEKWLITITSSAGSHCLLLFLSLRLFLPSTPLPFPLLFNFTTDQCCCQAIYLLRVVPQTKRGHRKPQLACHKYGQPAWTFSSGLGPDSEKLLLMHVGNMWGFSFQTNSFLSKAAGSNEEK